MPSNVVKTPRDEKLWAQAKQIVTKNYPKVKAGSDQYYALVMSIYKRMEGTGRRFGNPRTDAERRARHKKLYGTTKLPPRGTGLINPRDMIRQGKGRF